MDIFSGTSSGDLGVLALGLVLTGMVSGLVAGMLGVGGAIVVVPVMYHVLATLGVDETVRMHVAVGTSLAAIIPSACAAASAHSRSGTIDRALAGRWAIPVFLGSLLGSALSGVADGRTLSLLFAIVAFPVAAHLVFAGERRIADRLPQGATGLAMAALIGGVSTAMGVGSEVSVPSMTLGGMSIPRAVGTASVFAAIISLTGTICALISGWHAKDLPPWSLGYVNLAAFLLVAPGSFFATSFGVSIARMTDMKRMRIVFAVFIAIATARMLLDALA
ncbi:MAG TPA: sulfite exporter TauE/SafE family protein [Rhizomicrobium sp.]